MSAFKVAICDLEAWSAFCLRRTWSVFCGLLSIFALLLSQFLLFPMSSLPKTSNAAKGAECISFTMVSVFSGLCC